MPPESSSESRVAKQYFATDRVNAVTDGVFAIALTLLVLELKLPDPDSTQSVLTLMIENWHDFAAWVVSFAALGRFWIVQHALVTSIERCRLSMVVYHFVLLGLVSIVPFSASLIGNYDLSSTWATVVFALNVGLISVVLGVISRQSSASLAALRSAYYLAWLPALACAACALAIISPRAAVLLVLVEMIWGLARLIPRAP